jgi:protein SCO1/2
MRRTSRFRLGSALIAVAAAWLSCVGSAAAAADAQWDAKAALATSQAAIGSPIGDHVLRTPDGLAVNLADLRGRPLVVSMVYTSCHHICPTTTRHLAQVVDVARDALGEDSFRIVTIGFDTRHDTPDAMRDFARQQGVDEPGWEFLSADAQTIDRLSAELGFIFQPSAGGFDHLIQTTVIDAQGVIYRQIYGTSFEVPQLVEPLKELVYGRPKGHSLLANLSNRVRLFCTVYDPSSNRYVFDYSLFIGIAIGFGCLAAVGTFLVREWRRGRTT